MINIFVEGDSDIKFLEDYLSYLEVNKNCFKVESINGKDKLKNIQMKLMKNSDNNIINLIIFDSDDNFKQRRDSLLKFRNENNLKFELFLFPNNSDSGDLEILLENIIPENNKEIINCMNNYKSCIVNLNRNLTVPINKAKIYAYLEALLPKKDSKKIHFSSRDYQNKEHWNLDSEYLLSLKGFLLDNID